MHIVFWAPAWPLGTYPNGIVTYVHWMRIELIRQGHKVSVFTSGLHPDCRDSDVYQVNDGWFGRTMNRLLRRTGRSDVSLFGWGRVIAKNISSLNRRNTVDVIEMEESFGWMADVAQVTKIPVVVKLHGPAFLSLTDQEASTKLGRLRILREGAALEKMTTLVSPARSTLAQTIDTYGLAPQRSLVMCNPVSIVEDIEPWNKNESVPYRIVFVGRFDRRKGGDVVIQALSVLLKRKSAATLTFIGPDVGIEASDGSSISIKQFVESFGDLEMSRRITYLGAVSNKEAMRLRMQAAVVVVASRWENAAYTVLEAMLQGCPLVCTDADACREVIEDRVTGLLAKSGSPEDFAEKIELLFADDGLASAIGKAARQYVMEYHSASVIAKQSVDLYRSLTVDDLFDRGSSLYSEEPVS